VPPYLRDVVPSACWKRLEDDAQLVGGDADARVDHRELRARCPAETSVGSANWASPCACSMRIVTVPVSVNFTAFESRFFSTCCRRCSSVTIAGGTFAPEILHLELEALLLAQRLEGALHVVAYVGERHVAGMGPPSSRPRPSRGRGCR